MHTRVAPKGTLLDPDRYDDVVADVTGFLRERMEAALAAGVGEEQILLDPGPDFAKTPAQTVAVLRRLDAVLALGPAGAAGRLAQGLRRRADRAGARASAARGRWPRSRTASTPARTSCASTTSPRRPTSWPSAPPCAATASSPPTRA